MTQYEKLAIQLVKAREAANKTQADAARYLGKTYQAISNWERCYSKIDSVSLLNLLLYYEVDIYDFLEKCDFVIMRRIDGADDRLPQDAREVAGAYASLDTVREKNIVRNSLSLAPLPAGDQLEAPRPRPRRRTG